MNSRAPEVSVVIPLYNKRSEIERAMRSVLTQTFQDFEVIVVNDGSTDDGPDIVRRIDDPRIRVMDQENAGVSAARNRGIAEARSDLIAFLDADDEWKPCFLEEIMRLRAAYPPAAVFATNYLFCDGDGVYSSPIIKGLPKHPWDGILEDYFGVASRSDPPLWTSAVAVSKQAIISVGGFPAGVKSGEDLLTWARLAASCGIAYTTETQAICHLRSTLWGAPTRSLVSDDQVGAALQDLLDRDHPEKQRGLRGYMAMWHRMRAATAIKCGEPRQAFHEIAEAARYCRISLRLVAYSALAMLPKPISVLMISSLQRFRRLVPFTPCKRLADVAGESHAQQRQMKRASGKLRVLSFISIHERGATEALAEEALHLSKLEQTDFLFLSGEREQRPGVFARLESNGVRYRRIEGLDTHRSFRHLVREFASVVSSYAPHVVHAQTNWQLAIATACKMLHKHDYKTAYTIRAYRNNYLLRGAIARVVIGVALWLAANKVIAGSTAVRRAFWFLGDKVDVQFFGIDANFYGQPSTPEFDAAKRIVYPAAFRRGKRQETLIRAVRRYIDVTGDHGIELWLAGTGKYMSRCKKLTRALGLEEKVHFPGYLSRQELLECYLRCQFAVIPSISETFGRCIAEPFTLGRVVISRRVGVAEDIIVDGHTGFLFDSEDDLVELLRTVLPDPSKCRQVAGNALAKRDVFKLERISGEYESLLREMLSEERR